MHRRKRYLVYPVNYVPGVSKYFECASKYQAAKIASRLFKTTGLGCTVDVSIKTFDKPRTHWRSAYGEELWYYFVIEKPEASDDKIELDESLIPAGFYCHEKFTFNEETKRCSAKPCPYWGINDNYPHQENGYCRFLNRGDWEDDHIGLLWDQVKECGIKDYIEDDVEE
jgi:hypothetical protein